jgi:hypothetical protein
MDWLSFSPTIWTCKHDVFNGNVLGQVEVPTISTEIMPDERDMRKMVADLVQEDDEEVYDSLGDQFKNILVGDDFNQEYEFYEEVTDESDVNCESRKDDPDGSDGSFYIV